jgi:CheY-like chemotaxis protein
MASAASFSSPPSFPSGWERGGDALRLCFIVIDNGAGIAPQDMLDLFKPFRQFEAGTRYRGRGTGLGLAISLGLARGLGGHLGAASTLGRGSAFVLELRVQPITRTAGSAGAEQQPTMSPFEAATGLNDTPSFLHVAASWGGAGKLPGPDRGGWGEGGGDHTGSAMASTPTPNNSDQGRNAQGSSPGPFSSSSSSVASAAAAGGRQVGSLLSHVGDYSSGSGAQAMGGTGSSASSSSTGTPAGPSPTAAAATYARMALWSPGVEAAGVWSAQMRQVAAGGRVEEGGGEVEEEEKEEEEEGADAAVAPLSSRAAASDADDPVGGPDGGWGLQLRSAGAGGRHNLDARAAGVVGAAAPAAAAPGHHLTASPGAGAPPNPFLGMRILVVDDVPSNRTFLARLLRKRLAAAQGAVGGGAGDGDRSLTLAVVDEAEDGQQAVDAVLAHGLDYYTVLCMDGDMPVLDGYGATRRLLSEFGYRGLVLGCTGNALPQDQELFLQAGAAAVLVKPIEPAEVLQRARDWVEGGDRLER